MSSPAIFFMIDFPLNWLQKKAQFLVELNQEGLCSFDLVAKRLKDSSLPVYASLQINDELSENEKKDLEQIREKIELNGFELIEAKNSASEVERMHQVYSLNSQVSHLIKVRPDDFCAPHPKAIQSAKEAEGIDFDFSFNHPVGMNWETWSRGAIEKLLVLNWPASQPAKYAVCRQFHEQFQRRRHNGGWLDDHIPQLRYCLDHDATTNHLKDYLSQGGEICPKKLEKYARENECFLVRRIEPFHNHRKQFHLEDFENPMAVQFLERGLFGRRYMKETSRVLDLCSGAMLLPQYVYSTGAGEVVCVDSSPESRELHRSLNLQEMGISFLNANILSEEGWEEIRSTGRFDVVTFTAAIEHFTKEQQDFLLENISLALKDGGILLGDTVLFNEEGYPGHWQHKNEITTHQQLIDLLKPWFQEQDVFVSHYKNVDFQPIYFICKK